jgi:signal peptidase II
MIDRGSYRGFGIIAGVVVLLDQLSKWIVLETIPLYTRIEVIPGFFNLIHIRNPGGAFGFMAANASPVRHWLFLIAIALAMAMIIYFYRQTPRAYRFLGVALALIFGGAVGNLIDRLRFGEVIDFLDVYIGQLHWPAFNVADSAVTVGVVIFIIHIVFKKMPY